MSRIMSKVRTVFSRIGSTNGTAFDEATIPATDHSNEERDRFIKQCAAAHELAVARELATMAEKRKDAALREAVSIGILGDYEGMSAKTPHVLVLPNAAITVKRNEDSVAIDSGVLIRALTRSGVNAAILNAAIAEASKVRAGNRNVTVTLTDGGR